MTIEKYEEIKRRYRIYPSFKTLFDEFSHEFNSHLTIAQKVDVIGRMVYDKVSFNALLREYETYYPMKTHRHVREAINGTLITLIAYLRPELQLKYFKHPDLQAAGTRKQILADFKMVFTKYVNDNFSIEKLIDSYFDYKVSGKFAPYKLQSDFFKVDFDRDLTEKLLERNRAANLPAGWSYLAQHKYLIAVLLPKVYENGEILDFNMEYQMPSTRCMVYYNRKHYPKKIQKRLAEDDQYRQRKLLAYAEDLIGIIYWGNEFAPSQQSKILKFD